MSSVTYPIAGNESVRKSCRQAIAAAVYKLDPEIDWEVVVRPLQQHKTLRQLGALFGLWIKNISDQTGETTDEIHARLKNDFLVEIYMTDPMTDEQLMWVELMLMKYEANDQEGLARTRRQVSLAWSTKDQMVQYITRIHEHCMSNNIILEDTHKIRGFHL